jgi:SulP family sulfate permease
LVTGGIVIATMFLLPKPISKRVPSSLVGILLAMLVVLAFGFQEPAIGAIPQTLILDNHLLPSTFFSQQTLEQLPELFVPALSVAALGAIESLLCGAVAGNMTGKKMDGDQELIAQGIGNIIIPFFGGVPATAAIARSSVGVASGGVTRLTSIFHALFLLAAAFLLAPLISQVPLAALSGVLIVTAIRMNEWTEIRWMFRHRFKSAIAAFLITMLATAYLDLTQAVILGVALSAIIFINQISSINISLSDVDLNILEARGIRLNGAHEHIRIAYLTGPLFFGAAAALRKTTVDLERVPEAVIILSMRGVPLLDMSGLEFIEELLERQKKHGGELLLCAVQPAVKRILDRSHLSREIGEQNFFWSADQAILAASEKSA